MIIVEKDICRHSEGWKPNWPDIEFEINMHTWRCDLIHGEHFQPDIILKCKTCEVMQRDSLFRYIDRTSFLKTILQKHTPSIICDSVNDDWSPDNLTMKIEEEGKKLKHTVIFNIKEIMPSIISAIKELPCR